MVKNVCRDCGKALYKWVDFCRLICVCGHIAVDHWHGPRCPCTTYDCAKCELITDCVKFKDSSKDTRA